MTLTVPFAEFAAAVKRVLGAKEAYVSSHGRSWRVTAAADGKLVTSTVTVPKEKLTSELKEEGLQVHEGAWSLESLDMGPENGVDCYVAAVSYVSGDDKPGLWMDAFTDPPTGVQVLKAMYDEMLSTGELQDATFEDFLKLANANVIILAPADIRSFAHAKDC